MLGAVQSQTEDPLKEVLRVYQSIHNSITVHHLNSGLVRVIWTCDHQTIIKY